jgi:hypothetical protein
MWAHCHFSGGPDQSWSGENGNIAVVVLDKVLSQFR